MERCFEFSQQKEILFFFHLNHSFYGNHMKQVVPPKESFLLIVAKFTNAKMIW